jgi:hypothetical protein
MTDEYEIVYRGLVEAAGSGAGRPGIDVLGSTGG